MSGEGNAEKLSRTSTRVMPSHTLPVPSKSPFLSSSIAGGKSCAGEHTVYFPTRAAQGNNGLLYRKEEGDKHLTAPALTANSGHTVKGRLFQRKPGLKRDTPVLRNVFSPPMQLSRACYSRTSGCHSSTSPQFSVPFLSPANGCVESPGTLEEEIGYTSTPIVSLTN